MTATSGAAGSDIGNNSAADADSGNVAAQQRWNTALMNNFGTPQIEFVSGEGMVLQDADGREYLDFLGGIAVNALGYAHPAIVAAVSAQIAALPHVSNYFSTPPVLALAEKLRSLTGDESARVLFTNSGTESNEAAFKLARLTGRPRVIATEGSFHGRSMGALSLTGQPDKRAAFLPLVPGVEFVPYGDTAALQAAVDQDPGSVAAFMCEPIQGESGVITPPDDYLAQVREITAQAGALMIVDEVQTGIGRTGAWFAYQHAGITPDVVTLAKGLGGGLPLGAVIGFTKAAQLFTPGSHGSTFAGNPVCAAAALAVLRTIETDKLLAHASEVGNYLASEIMALAHPLIEKVRGQGLLRGVVLTEPIAAAVNKAAAQAGFLTNAPAANVLRLAPPLIVSRSHIDQLVRALPDIITAA